MTTLGLLLLSLPLAVAAYAYVGYPLALLALGAVRRPRRLPSGDPPEWPLVTVLLPAYNEEAVIGATLEALLALRYPAGRLHVLVMSDASTDRTDEIVRSFADRGVELLRLPRRGGKTAAENAAADRIRGEIVVNTDATIRILPDSLKPLVRVFQDPEIGLASGRDVSVSVEDREASQAEGGYVGYEMWVRSLETRIGSIVGASGCFYAIRRELYASLFPEALSRDFASALICREHGYRAVSVDEAVCLVPRSPSLRREFRRKVRTLARGLDTLWYKRALLNPFRYGSFALMLASHKLCRWLVYPLLPAGLLGVVLLALSSSAGAALAALLGAVGVAGLVAVYARRRIRVPAPVAFCGYLLITSVAGVLAWIERLRGTKNPVWEPTRRHLPDPNPKS